LNLHFSEGAEARFTKLMAAGADMQVGSWDAGPADNTRLLVPLPKLGAGTCTVTWRAVGVDTPFARRPPFYRCTMTPCC